MPGAYHRIPFHRADGEPVFIETTRPELIPACVALVAHPDDERYQPLFGTTVRTPLFGVEVAGQGPRAGRSREGLGHRHDLHLRRPHRRHLVARAAARRPARSSTSNGRLLPETPEWIDVGRRARRTTPSSPARPPSRPRPASSSCSASRGELDGEPRADHPPGQVLREGRPPARDRHQPPVVHPQRRPRRRPARGPAAPGQGAATGTRRTCRSATRTGSTASTATGSSPASASSASRSRSGTASTPTARSTTTQLYVPAEDRLPVDPSSDAPDGLRRVAAGPARRLRRRPRRHGHLGHLVADPADRHRLGGGPRPLRPHVPDGPAPAGPRHHPHLAVLDGPALAPRVRHAAVDRRRARRAGSSTPTARRCRSRRATSSRPARWSTSSAPTPSATGRPTAGPAPTPRSTRAR